jgi:ABC-type transporter Mla MlaB component
MKEQPFSVTQEKAASPVMLDHAGQPGTLTIAVEAMTRANARALWEAGRPFLDGRAKIIDLAAVKTVDSTALAVLLEWQRENIVLARQPLGNTQDTESSPGKLSFQSLPASLTALAGLYSLETVFRDCKLP